MSLVIRPGDLAIHVSGEPLTDFPTAGTILSIEKVTQRSIAIEGRGGSITFIRNTGRLYRVTLNLMQGHPSDVFMMAAITALAKSEGVLSFTYKYGGVKYTSPALDIMSDPVRAIAADDNPMSVYDLAGSFPEALVGAFAAAPILTADQIKTFIPPAQ